MRKESALNVYGMTKKQYFTDTYQLLQYFDVGINEEGYWCHDHMALQNKDEFDVLSYLYPNYNFVLLVDQSTGHRKRSTDALHAPIMCVKWGGNQPPMHATTIHELGPFPVTLTIGDSQHMQFQKGTRDRFISKIPKHTRQKKKQEIELDGQRQRRI